MAVTNVKSRWVEGDLVFYNVSGTEFVRFTGTGQVEFAAGGIQLAAGALKIYTADGQDETMDTTYTVTGVAAGDTVTAVLFISTKASVATIEVLDYTAFTVTGANEITTATAVDRSNDQLLFFVFDNT